MQNVAWIPDNGAATPEVSMGMFELADLLKGLKDQKAELEDALKAVNAEIEKTEQKLVEEMISEELQNFTRNGQIYYLTRKVYASTVPERKPELFSWLRKEGHGDMIQETVNANTLAAFVRESLDNSEEDELPADLAPLVNITRKQAVGLRKASGGKKK